MDRKQIADLLRGNPSVTCIDKKHYQVDLKSPVILKLKKDRLVIGGGREIDFRDVRSYLKGLTNMSNQSVKYDRNELRRNTTVLAKLYKDRVVKGSKKDSSFMIDQSNPSKVTLSNTGEVRINWADGSTNVYEYDSCIKHLTEFGAAFVANKELNGQATQAAQDNEFTNPANLGPNCPQPANVNLPPREGQRKLTKRRGSKKKLNKPLSEPTSKPANEPANEPTSEPTSKPKKDRVPRSSKLGNGGSPLDEKTLLKAKSEIEGLKQGASIRLLISIFDADNDSIVELLSIDDKAVQRTRRALLREKRKAS